MKALKKGKYPYSKIIIYYVLIIGLVNAFALASLSTLMFKNETLVEVPFIFLVFSFFITTSPAFILLSIWFCYKKYVFHQINDIYSLMKKSLFSFMVYLFFNLMIVWEKFVYSKANIIFIGISIVLFVLLSTLTLYQILPKTEHYLKNKYKREKMVARKNKNKEVVVSNQHLENKVVVSYQYLEQALKNVGVLRENHENKAKYPRLMVFLVYSQFGGSIGAFLTIIGGFVYFFFEEYNSVFFQDVGLLIFILSYIVVGFIFFLFAGIVGAIPAILTGAYIALSKIYLRNVWSYLHIFMVGYLSSLLIFREWWLGLVGGISSVLVGYIIVPKSESDCGEDW